MNYSKAFPSGLKFAFKRSKSPVAYTALTIKSGTRNEPEAFPGMAHMTEHMLFKGTVNRTPQEIDNCLELLGGDLNAYTAKEETVLFATVLKEDTERAVDLLMELAFQSTFPQKELDKERLVVIDEINMYKDSPSECIFEDFENRLFGSHTLGRIILGTAASLRKIKSNDIISYVRENFTPDRMCISIVADMAPQKAEEIARKVMEKYIPSSLQSSGEYRTVSDVVGMPAFTEEISKKNHQANCIIGTTAYSTYDDRRFSLALLSNILGGPSSNSRLNQNLREANALVYAIDSIYTKYSETGSFMVYFGCEKGNVGKCLEKVAEELRKLREERIPASNLRAAKKQLLGQLAISSDNGEAQALALGKNMVVRGCLTTDEEIRAGYNSVTSAQIQDIAADLLSPERLSTLIYK